MPLYRRMPGQPIEAIQFFRALPIPPMVKKDGAGYYVVTIHKQAAYLADSDWILPEPEPSGQYFYPVRDSIFHATYEHVEGALSKQVYEGIGDELDNPPASIMDDPSDTQAQMGHKPK